MSADAAKDDVQVVDVPGKMRFEILADGELAGFAQYVRKAGRLIFVHTEVDPAFGGRGIGSKLASDALDAARAEGAPVIPLCPFIAEHIEKHPAYADLVDQELLAQFG